MTNLEMFLTIAFMIIVFLGCFLFYYLLTEIGDLERQIRNIRSDTEKDFNAHCRRIEDLRDRLHALEKHLGIEYVKRIESCYTKAKETTK